MGGGLIESRLNDIKTNIRHIFNDITDIYGEFFYGFDIDLNESDPNSVITYIGKNRSYKPAHMDCTNDVFDYGDWGDAWFIKNIKVVALNTSGEIICELDKDDYTKDVNGNDVSNIIDRNNVFVIFPKIYVLTTYTGDGKYRFCFVKSTGFIEKYYCWEDETYKGIDGHYYNYMYMGVYDTYVDRSTNKLCSYSGKSLTDDTTEMTFPFYRSCAKHIDGNDDDSLYDVESYQKHMLINLLLLLIGKSTDTQAVFGNGKKMQSIYSTNVLRTGTMDDKGLFWGTNSDDTKGVKIFGIENWWGNLGHIVTECIRYVEEEGFPIYGRPDYIQYDDDSAVAVSYMFHANDIYPYPIFDNEEEINDFEDMYTNMLNDESDYIYEVWNSNGYIWEGKSCKWCKVDDSVGYIAPNFGIDYYNQYFPDQYRLTPPTNGDGSKWDGAELYLLRFGDAYQLNNGQQVDHCGAFALGDISIAYIRRDSTANWFKYRSHWWNSHITYLSDELIYAD